MRFSTRLISGCGKFRGELLGMRFCLRRLVLPVNGLTSPVLGFLSGTLGISANLFQLLSKSRINSSRMYIGDQRGFASSSIGDD